MWPFSKSKETKKNKEESEYKFRILVNGYGQYFIQEYFLQCWANINRDHPYTSEKEAEQKINELVEYREKSKTVFVKQIIYGRD